MKKVCLFPHSQRENIKRKILKNHRSRIRHLNNSKESLISASQRLDPVINLSMPNFEPQKVLKINDFKELINENTNSQLNLTGLNSTRNNTQVFEGKSKKIKIT